MKSFTDVILFVLCFVMYSLGMVFIGEKSGYKQGQIDAINGTVKYELKVNPDKTSLWVEKK